MSVTDPGTSIPTPLLTVGTTHVALDDTALFGGGVDEVWLSTPSTNTGLIYLGDSSATNAGAGNIQAILSAGTGIVITGGVKGLYAVGSASGQILAVGGRHNHV